MTRFARAKGSKSSNEKKPEEATSWSEMKKGMLSKQKKKPEPVPTKETKAVPKKTTQTEWASLGDDSSPLLGLHLKRINKADKVVKKKEKEKKKKKKVKTESNEELKTTEIGKSSEDSVKTKKVKKRKIKEVKENDDDITPKIKKKKVNGNVDEMTPKIKNKKVNRNDDDITPNPKKIKLSEAKDVEGEEKNNVANKTKNKKKFKKGDKESFKKEKGKFNKKFDQRTNFFNRESIVDEIIVNGEKVPIVKFQGFNVMLEDAERLRKLRLDMIREGIPKNKLEAAIKLERRRAEKALSRLKKAVCFHCRGAGHLLSNCPLLVENQSTSTGICYKCGSTEHSALECKVVRGTNFQFAECFICKEQGHIARQCPDNPRGLYPQGGACRECGDVTHLRKDCPVAASKVPEETVTVGVRRERDFECLDEEIEQREKLKSKKVNKKKLTVKF